MDTLLHSDIILMGLEVHSIVLDTEDLDLADTDMEVLFIALHMHIHLPLAYLLLEVEVGIVITQVAAKAVHHL